MAADGEIIEVRADERLDTARLEPYLRQNLPRTEGAFELAQFGGGHANLTYLIRFGKSEYVLRRPPLGPVAPSSHDMNREHRVLENLWRVFPLAPRSFFACTDEEIIGAPFHVMERRHGIVVRNELPGGTDWTPDLNRRVGEMIIDVLAELHCVDPSEAGLGDLGHPQGFAERQLAGWSKRWEAAKHQDMPAMGEIIAWLEKEIRPNSAVALIHNDFKLDNLLLDATDPGKAAAVLDWDMCTRGDPLMDFGYLMTYWGEAEDDPKWRAAASMPTWHAGFPTRAEAIERYARLTGFDCGHIHWYHVFGVFKIAVVLQQIYVRFLRGQTRDQRFAGFGERIAGLIDKALVLTRRPL